MHKGSKLVMEEPLIERMLLRRKIMTRNQMKDSRRTGERGCQQITCLTLSRNLLTLQLPLELEQKLLSRAVEELLEVREM